MSRPASPVRRRPSRFARLTGAIAVGQLGWPMFFGGWATIAFYGAVSYGYLNHPLIDRYLCSHWVCYATTAMFLTGAAAALIKALNVAGQILGLGTLRLPDDSEGIDEETPEQHSARSEMNAGAETPVARWTPERGVVFGPVGGSTATPRSAESLTAERRRSPLAQLDDAEAALSPTTQLAHWADGRTGYLAGRVRALVNDPIFEIADPAEATTPLEDRLRQLTDADADTQHESYALIRLIIWATPLLGFLGTVLGIAEALGSINPEQFASGIEQAMGGLTSGLYVAFDTTALALLLSMVLMTLMFLVERQEVGLLSTVDRVVRQEIVPILSEAATDRGGLTGTNSTRAGSALPRPSQDAVVAALSQQQAVFERFLTTERVRMEGQAAAAATAFQQALQAAVADGLAAHAGRLIQAEREAAEEAGRRWERWQVSLSDNARSLHLQQKELFRIGQVLEKVVEATGTVTSLQTALEENLDTLARTASFDQAVVSLAATAQLLASRVGTPAHASGRMTETGPGDGARADAAFGRPNAARRPSAVRRDPAEPERPRPAHEGLTGSTVRASDGHQADHDGDSTSERAA